MTNNRRDFLRAAALTALSQGRIRGANDRVRVGAIGMGTRGPQLLAFVQKYADIVALADAYPPRIGAVKQMLRIDAREYADYRQLLDQQDIDAVFIAAPDHWHVTMAIAALSAGKDVYLEKPVSHTIEEGDRLLAFAAGTSQIVQAGYQQRSWPHFQRAHDVLASGVLGAIGLVTCSWFTDYLNPATVPPVVDTQQLNWKAFLGSAPDQPYDPLRYWRWRWFWDFGGGHLTDLFSHLVDVVHWYMGQDSPLAVTAMGTRNLIQQFEVPDTINASYEYPGGFQVVHTGSAAGSLDGIAIMFHGSGGLMKVNRDGFNVYQERVPTVGTTGLPTPLVSAQSTGDGTDDHVRNFLDCVRSRNTPNAELKTAVAAARVAHLGNISLRTGARLSL